MKPRILILSHYKVVFGLYAGAELAGRSNALNRRDYYLTALPRRLKNPAGTLWPQF